MASGRLSKKGLQLQEIMKLNRQFRRASFDRRNKEDAAGRAARRSDHYSLHGRTLAASNFKAAFTKAGVPEGPMEIGDILSDLGAFL